MSEDYWRKVHAATDDDLAAVNYPSFPPAFNRLIDRIYHRAIDNALAGLTPGRALEIGCGRGRWLGRLRERGWRADGIDIAGRPTTFGSALALPFPDSVFDLTLAITVIQHLDDKDTTFHEMCRVTMRGGHVLLIEILDRPGVRWQKHMMPESEETWRRRIARAGLSIEDSRFIEHLPLLQIAERLRPAPRSESGTVPTSPGLLKKALTWASYPLEPLTRHLLPSTGSHKLFLMRKP